MGGFLVVSVNVSDKKGVVKKPVDSIELNETGIIGDAHAGDWHRQVSLLAQEGITKAEKVANENFPPGTFAENITTRGIELHKTAIFDRFKSKNTLLEVTQIGKKCHSKCEIGKKIGNCIMPIEGIFCRVLKGGTVKSGDTFDFLPRVIKAKIITLSDRAYKGVYKDLSGPKVKEMLINHFESSNRHFSIESLVLPDEGKLLEREILKSIEENDDIVITTGGTGISERDITPDIVKPLLAKEIPGLMEHIRVKYGSVNPNALISRSIAGVSSNTLIYCLPGSVKGIMEYMSEITPTIEHCFRMLNSIDVH